MPVLNGPGSGLTFFRKHRVGPNLFFLYRAGTGFIPSVHGPKLLVLVLTQPVLKSLSRRDLVLSKVSKIRLCRKMFAKNAYIFKLALVHN